MKNNKERRRWVIFKNEKRFVSTVFASAGKAGAWCRSLHLSVKQFDFKKLPVTKN